MKRRVLDLARRVSVAIAMGLFVLFATAALRAQTLTITSPATGTVVNPGQTVPVTVAASGATFDMVILVAHSPIANGQLLTSPPYDFSIQIPTDISPGLYTLTVDGDIAPGGSGIDVSDAISVDVERPDAPVSMRVDPSPIALKIGDSGYLCDVIATFSDGSSLHVYRSTLVSYESDTPVVATVNAYGIISAISPGTANINVTYGALVVQVPVTVWQPVTVSPAATFVSASQTQQFYAQTAMPSGTDPSVTWSIFPEVGSIDGTGLYTAPSSIAAETRVVVTATSVANPAWSGSAELQVFPPVAVNISPSSANLTAGTSQEFAATVANAPDQLVNWSFTPSGIGATTWDGANPIYTAPPAITAPQTINVTATYSNGTSTTGGASITLIPSVALSVTPAASTLYSSQTQQFTAIINYTSGANVVWSISPNIGTIDAYGFYTAPSTIPHQQTVTVVATVSAGYTATAVIALVPRASSIPVPTGLTAVATSVSEIDLSWKASQNSGNIVGYSIFRNGAPVGVSMGTSYADRGLIQSTSYNYTVAAYDAQGNISAPSVGAAATTFPSSILGLVASLNFDEGTGTVAYDSSGNGNNGVITNATWTNQGRLTNALQFDGTSSWVTVPDSSSLDLTNGLTIEGWVNASSIGNWQTLAVKEQSNDLCYGLFNVNLWPAANLFVGSEQISYGSQQISLLNWNHLALTYDGTSQNLYVNGAPVGSYPLSGPIATSSQPLRIGGNSVWGQYFGGVIEEVRIYNRALAASEILNDMRAMSVSVSPNSATLYTSQRQQFTATVTNAPASLGTAVTWSISPPLGTIDATGNYTAPSSILSVQTIGVTATSQFDSTKTGTATVTLQPQISSSISAPQGLTATAASCSQINLSWTASTEITEINGNVAGYYILRNGTLTGTSTTSSYSDRGLLLSTAYTYTIIAYDTQGFVSNQSASVIGTTVVCSSPQGLVAYYNFDEGSGTNVYDSSGNGNNGTILNVDSLGITSPDTSVNWTNSGIVGGSLVFGANGIGTEVQVPDSSSLDITQAVTVEAWVNPTYLSGDAPVINKGVFGTAGYALFANSSISNTPAGFAFTGAGDNSVSVFAGPNLPVPTWTHIATTYDGTTATLFVNGVNMGEEVSTGMIAVDSTRGPLTIGAAFGSYNYGSPSSSNTFVGASGYFSGMLDEIRIYNRALSQAEILNDFSQPPGNISVSPASVQLSASGTQQFLASAAVKWSLSPTVGTIDNAGFYVAPAIIVAPQTVIITATSQANITASSSATITLVPAILSSIPVPQGLTATTVSPSEIDLTWTASDPNLLIAGYLIFRNGTPIGNSPSTTYADLGVACVGSYTYSVVAYDYQGNNSAQSVSASASVNTAVGIASPGLVAFYNLNEGQGTIVHDCSGNGNNGVIDPASWSSSGRWGTGLALNRDKWVTVPDSKSLELTAGMTLEAWINPAIADGEIYAVGKGTMQQPDYSMGVDGVGVENSGYDFEINQSNTYFNSEDSLDFGITPQRIPVNTWTHLAYTFDGATVFAYMNGVQQQFTSYWGPLPVTNTSSEPLCIGCNLGTLFAEGTVDDVRIYNRPLSQAEILSDMQNSLVPVLALNPGSVTLSESQTQQFIAALTKTANTNVPVIWTISPNVGTISASGLYTAPSTVGIQQVVMVTATSQSDPSKTATSRITLIAPYVSLSPSTVTVNVGQVQQFTATTNYLKNTAVSYSLSPNIGSFDEPHGYYVAPSSVSSPQTVTLTATSVEDTTKTGTAQITILPAISVAVNPSSSVLFASQTQQFSATVTNTPDTSVTWSASVGTIDANGLYTAPAVNATSQAVQVVAVSQADGTTTGSALITLLPLESASISVPGGLTALPVSAGEVDLSWTASVEAGGGVAGYNILRNGSLIGTSSTTSYSDLGLLATTRYTYAVVAYDALGNSSALSASASGTTLPALPNLVAYYNFNEGTGTIANDLSGNGNNGAITGATWTNSGKQGNALAFDGSGGWVEVPDSPSLDLTTGVTLEAWVNQTPSSASDGWAGFIVKEQSQDVCYGLFSTGAGDWPAADVFTSGSAEQFIYGPLQIPVSTWTHLATTYDGTTQSMYVNGALVASTPRTGTIVTASQPLHIGGDSIWGDYLNGMIDEVRIYNRALSQSEIQGDMQQGINIALAPSIATLSASQTEQFNAVILTGTTDAQVTWSLALAADAPSGAQPGNITGAGLYTAPSTVSAQYTVLVTAQSQANHASVVSASITLVPPTNLSDPGLTVTSSANPSMAGGLVTFTVTATNGTGYGGMGAMGLSSPYGTVTIADGPTILQSSQLPSMSLCGDQRVFSVLAPTMCAVWNVSFGITSLGIGDHAITVSYSGDSNYLPATASTVLSVSGTAATPTVGITSASESIPFGSMDTLAATVPGASGTITFTDNMDGDLAVVPLVSGTASYSAAGLEVGLHTITASYSGDGSNAPASSSGNVVNVIPATIPLVLTTSQNPVPSGASVSLDVSFPADATGSVNFLDGSQSVGTANVSTSRLCWLVCSLPNNASSDLSVELGVGAHYLTASYSGDGNYNAGVSNLTVVLVENAQGTVVGLSSSAATSNYGDLVTLTATVPQYATGTIQFLDGASYLGTAQVLSNGIALINVSTLAPGMHSVTAVYSGDAANDPGISSASVQTVN